MIKNFLKKNYKAFHFSLFINILFLLYFAVVFYCEFETNDDYAMKMIASGAFGSPDSHLVYINSVIGYILKTLYTISPHIPWYEVFQCLLTMFSLSVLMHILLNKGSDEVYDLLVMITVFLTAHSFYRHLQFTKTASILAIAGYILLDDSIRKKRKVGMGFSVILIIFASMMRENQFFVMSLLCVTVFLPILFNFIKARKDEEAKGNMIRLVVSGTVCLLMFVGVTLFHRADYRGEEWSYYSDYNALRAAVLDRQEMVYEENPSFYQNLGMCKTDFDMLASWNYDDPDFFDMDLFMALYESEDDLAEQDSLINMIKDLIINSINFFFNDASEFYFTFLFIFVFSYFIFMVRDKKDVFFAMAAISVMVFCILYCYFYRNCTYMTRTHISIFLGGIFIILYQTRVANKEIRVFPLSMLILLLFMTLSGTWFGEFRINSTLKIRDLQKISAMKEIRADDDHMYFKVTDENLDYVHGLFYDSNSYACLNLDGLGGWTTNLPLKLDHLSARGFRNILKEIIDNDHAYLIINNEERLHTILNYVMIHYNENAQIRQVKTIEANKSYGVYQIITR